MNLKNFNKNQIWIATLFLFSLNWNSLAQLTNESLTFDGENRSFLFYQPNNYDGSAQIPLVLNFHGGSGTHNEQLALSDMRGLADNEQFFIAYPQALPDPSDGNSANWIHKGNTGVDDVYFIEALINDLSANYNIDTSRIYACGYSLGGEFCYELACRLSNKITAIGVVSRTMSTGSLQQCNPSHPTALISILGTNDYIAPYEGIVWNGVAYYLSAEDSHNYWINYNNIDTSATIASLPNVNTQDGSTVESYLWKSNDGCIAVKHLKVIGGDHDWPGVTGNMDIDTDSELWSFMSQFNSNGAISCQTANIGELNHLSLNVYPNPFDNELFFESDESKNIKIYNAHGQILLKHDNYNSRKLKLPLLSEGIYFLSINGKIKRIIKN